MQAGIVAELGVLGRALAGDDEQRARRGDDEEPVADRHPDRDAAGHGAQHEPRGDGREVEHRFVLQPDAVRERDHHVAGDDEREVPGRGERERDRDDEQHRAEALRGGHRHLARRDRPQPLLRVHAIGVDVERVVPAVGAARREAEAHERDEGLDDRAAFEQHAGRARRREHEHVLRPLLRPREAEQRHREPAPLLALGGGCSRLRNRQSSNGSCSISPTSVSTSPVAPLSI